jgi:hypothetical protein
MKSSSSKIIFGGFYSPPFMNFDENRSLYGPLIDVARLLSRDFSLIPEIKNLDQKTLNAFNHSDIDIGLGIFETQFREPLGNFSFPLFLFELQGLGFKDYSFTNINEIAKADLRYGVKEGEIGHDYLISVFGGDWVSKNCVVIPASSSKDTWMLLSELSCDIVFCDSLTLANRQKEITEPTKFAFENSILQIKMSLLVNKASPLEVEQINNWLIRFAESEEYNSFISVVFKNGESNFTPYAIR